MGMMKRNGMFRKAADLLRKTFLNDERPCPGCGGTSKGQLPMPVLCHCCSDALADGLSTRKAEFRTAVPPKEGFVAVCVSPSAATGDLALKLMEGDAQSKRALAAAYAHAVPICEYLLTDAAHLLTEDPDDALSGLKAFTRAVASAFAVPNRGLVTAQADGWQEEAIARYSKGRRKRLPKSVYPVVVVESSNDAQLSSLAAILCAKGAERMLVIEAPRREDG